MKIIYSVVFLAGLYIETYAQTCQNCGVNQTNPEASLHVKGCGSTNSTFGFKVSNALNKTALFVHDDLKVGIGAASGTYQLEVCDTAASAGIQAVMRIANRYVAAANNGAELLFGANRTSSGMTNVAGVSGLITDIASGAYKGTLVFSTADNAVPAERMRIDHLGNTGIGTQSPFGRLHVYGAYTNGETATFQDSIYQTMFVEARSGSVYNPLVRYRDRAIIWRDSYFTIDENHGFVIGPWTSSLKGIRIDPSGKTSIGAPEHLARLDVLESVPLGGSVGNVSPITSFRASTEGVSGNRVMDNLWLLKKRTSDGWLGAVLHEGVSVDFVFNVPGTSTRTWWERDPSDTVQSWGDQSNTFMTLKGFRLGVGTAVPKSKLDVSGSVGAKVVSVNSNYTAGDETIILADADSWVVDITLPLASDCQNRIYIIKRVDNLGSFYACNVKTSGSDTIDGVSAKSLSYLQSVTVVSNGANWFIIQ